MKSIPIILLIVFLSPKEIIAQCVCDPLPINGNSQINVQNVVELGTALDQAFINNGNTDIIFAPGTYQLTGNLKFISDNMSNLRMIGATGNRNDVIIKGLGWNNSSVTHIFNVAADDFTIAHMTIGEVYYHAIQVHSNPADADNFTMQNVRIVDVKEQLLKVSGGGSLFADNGKIRCSEFEFTAGIGYQNYTGGIDAHRSVDWEVKYNVFKHIRSPDQTLAEHAIHFWRESSGTMVVANQIINSDRGIGFGLGNTLDNGHVGGVIMNNFVHTSRDVGIGLEHSPDTKIYNNTVDTDNYNNSIEYRFSATNNVTITNNLVNGNITDRSSGSSATLTTNFTFVSPAIFVDPNKHDYHLVAMPVDIVDQGSFVTEVSKDVDCESRPHAGGIDIGADEYLDDIVADIILDSACILLLPNPILGEFSIQGTLQEYEIHILDVNGNILQQINQSTGKVTIELSTLPNGIHFIQITHVTSGDLSMQKMLCN